MADEQIPIQPVEKPIICNPYEEPDQHWHFDRELMQMQKAPGRRAAGYWYKTDQVGAAQRGLFADEQWDDLPLINLLRHDVRRWRESGYNGASTVTKELLRHWASKDRLGWRLFFCQREAVETIIYLNELRIPGRSSRTGFKKFELADSDIEQLVRGERPGFYVTPSDFYPTFADKAVDPILLPLRRIGCKMATGSGKTVVMAMLIAWAFCNRGTNPNSSEFPSGVLVVCPNLTVKERLQVLRPEHPQNYYAEFDIVPTKYRPLLQMGKVLIANWHWFNPRSEHEEGGKTYAVVQKGPDTPETYAKWVLDDLYERLPIMVLNDEGHHCYRPAAATNGASAADKKVLDEEAEEATVWIEGLDRLNNHNPKDAGKPGISICVDLSATPFYIKGSGHPEGRPFPWLVSDFGLVDAIESGIVKIPRLPIMDTTGLPDPKYFKLWQRIREDLERGGAGNFFPGAAHKPKPEPVWREAEGALQQLAQQWKERFEYVRNAQPGQEHIPPVMIVVCDNTDIAELFHRKISGETEIEQVTPADVEEIAEENSNGTSSAARKKAKTTTVFGESAVLPEFANTPARKYTIRIDARLLAEAESEDPNKGKKDAAEALRKVVATVGKTGQPGEHVRCVVSVAMLNEGWDANNVTHILGVRAFGSQLLCEQVVGRGLRRLDYKPDATSGLLNEEYVDVYGIPFSVIPFKGRPAKATSPEDKPKNHVRALPERRAMEIQFPIVEGYAFALRKNLVRCDVDSMEKLVIEPNREPTATFISATVGYREGNPQVAGVSMPVTVQDRHAYYEQNHIQTIKFQITRLVVESLVNLAREGTGTRAAAFRLLSRHQLFPQVYAIVDEYVRKKVNFQGEHPSELGLDKYVTRIVERLRARIEPDETQGEPPLMPVLNRYKPLGTTSDVDFKTTKPCFPTVVSHINQVVADTGQWEQSAAFRLEMAARRGLVRCYVKNDRLGLMIAYEYLNIAHNYVPDYIVRLTNGLTLLLEIKGMEDNQDKAKHDAARRWISAVNNWGQLGQWDLHVCRSPQMLEKQLGAICSHVKIASVAAL